MYLNQVNFWISAIKLAEYCLCLVELQMFENFKVNSHSIAWIKHIMICSVDQSVFENVKEIWSSKKISKKISILHLTIETYIGYFGSKIILVMKILSSIFYLMLDGGTLETRFLD